MDLTKTDNIEDNNPKIESTFDEGKSIFAARRDPTESTGPFKSQK